MEQIHVSDLREIVELGKALVNEALDRIIDAIDTKILVGNIHVPAEKKVRKKRTRKVKVVEFAPPATLPDADGDHPFYGKNKREKKGAEES